MIKDTELNEKQRADAFEYISNNENALFLFNRYFELTKEHLVKIKSQEGRISELEGQLKDK